MGKLTNSSLIITTLNEENSIEKLLDSINNQTKKPNEIVIVDAGSTDKTVQKIRSYQKKLPIKLIIKPGVNRSQGRNTAIDQARGEIIAVTDAGCYLDKNWLKEICQPLEKKEIMAVAGNYQPIAKTPLEECLAAYTSANIYRKDKTNFLPSSRSIAFKKTLWEKTGGYPENLNYCEDLVFDQKIKKLGINFYFAGGAIAYWPQRKTLKQAFRQFYHYAYGDGQVFFSPYQTHSGKIALVFLRYFIGLTIFPLAINNQTERLILLLLLLAYLTWPITKNKKIISSGKALLISPLIQILADIAVMSGTTAGIFANLPKKL